MVTAISHASGDLYSWFSRDNGSSGPQARVINNATNSAREGLHALATDGNSKLIFAWLNLRNGNTELGVTGDGGSLGATGEKINYAWRREGTLFVTGNASSETMLAERGTHPVVVPRGDYFSYVWQNDGDLFWKSSASAASELLAQDAAFAAAAWSHRDGKAFIVWESSKGIFITSR